MTICSYLSCFLIDIMFGCCEDPRPPTQLLRQSTTYYEYSNTTLPSPILQPLTQPPPPLPKARRVKVKYRDSEYIKKQLQDSGVANFVDDEFPHRVSSLGKNFERPVIWIRIKEMVREPVYSLSTTLEDWGKFRCSNKCLQSALYLLRIHHPQLFIKLISKQLNDFGMYQFRLMLDGVVTEEIIDDYIPSSEGMPIYAKPYKINQVFPLLIQKVLAKVLGSYVEIPECPLGIIETLAGTPVAMWSLKPKISQERLLEVKKRIDIVDSTTCFMPRQGSLLGEQGLVEKEPYLLTSVHEVLYNGNPIVLYELMNPESKSDWNGPFHEFDEQNWSKVQAQQSQALKQRIRSNGCFMAEQTDLLKYFSIMSSIQKTDTRCLDWITLNVNQRHATFFTINIRVPQKIFIKTWGQESVRQTLILGRMKKNNEVEFVQGNMIENAKSNFVKAELQIGVYVLFIKVDWQGRKANQITLGSCSRAPLDLIPSSKAQYPDFLGSMFRRLAFGSNPLKPHLSNNNYNVYLLYRQAGYACVALKSLATGPTIYRISEKVLFEQGFKMKKPYANKPTIQVPAGQTVLVILKMLNSKSQGEQLLFPEGAIREHK